MFLLGMFSCHQCFSQDPLMGKVQCLPPHRYHLYRVHWKERYFDVRCSIQGASKTIDTPVNGRQVSKYQHFQGLNRTVFPNSSPFLKKVQKNTLKKCLYILSKCFEEQKNRLKIDCSGEFYETGKIFLFDTYVIQYYKIKC